MLAKKIHLTATPKQKRYHVYLKYTCRKSFFKTRDVVFGEVRQLTEIEPLNMNILFCLPLVEQSDPRSSAELQTQQHNVVTSGRLQACVFSGYSSNRLQLTLTPQVFMLMLTCYANMETEPVNAHT